MATNQEPDLLKGDKVMLFLKDSTSQKPVAYATSCGYDQSTDTIDTSNKMSGDWKDFMAGQNSFTISSESLLSMTTGQMSFAAMKAIADARTPVNFYLCKAVEGEDGEYTPGTVLASGKAIFTALSLKADNGAVCTSSATLQGKGASGTEAPV